MQVTLTPHASRAKPESFKPVFKLFIACEDPAALVQARKVQLHVRALCENEAEISPSIWSFSLLRANELRAHAAREIAHAEMIIIALNGGAELPAQVKSLLEGLPIRPKIGQPALVALIGKGGKASAQAQDHVPYLRGIARHHGLDFFCNCRGWENLAAANSEERIQHFVAGGLVTQKISRGFSAN